MKLSYKKPIAYKMVYVLWLWVPQKRLLKMINQVNFVKR